MQSIQAHTHIERVHVSRVLSSSELCVRGRYIIFLCIWKSLIVHSHIVMDITLVAGWYCGGWLYASLFVSSSNWLIWFFVVVSLSPEKCTSNQTTTKKPRAMQSFKIYKTNHFIAHVAQWLAVYNISSFFFKPIEMSIIKSINEEKLYPDVNYARHSSIF